MHIKFIIHLFLKQFLRCFARVKKSLDKLQNVTIKTYFIFNSLPVFNIRNAALIWN